MYLTVFACLHQLLLVVCPAVEQVPYELRFLDVFGNAIVEADLQLGQLQPVGQLEQVVVAVAAFASKAQPLETHSCAHHPPIWLRLFGVAGKTLGQLKQLGYGQAAAGHFQRLLADGVDADVAVEPGLLLGGLLGVEV
jgi:hypothetical protein